MSKAKSWRQGESGEPNFPSKFTIVKRAVLQVTDIATNRNKYYGIELHQAPNSFRVFTHYGRTDDLETNPESGAKESRYYSCLAEADSDYSTIYREKTSPKKGYKELSLASSKIGSNQARGQSAGEIDQKTLSKLSKPTTPVVVPKINLHQNVQNLIRYIYDEATHKLTTSVAAKITANGIETPLGVLTLGQIEKGEAILQQLYDLYKKKQIKGQLNLAKELSGHFYTMIPHRIGRTRDAVDNSVLTTLEQFDQKQQTLQLMKDMLKVNGSAGGNVLFNAKVESEYLALGCNIEHLDSSGKEFKNIENYFMKSRVDKMGMQIKHIYAVKRDQEHKDFDTKVGNERLLFHGSSIQNWVGILSRGILLPKIVVSMGIRRTDAGWLGSGIYFGDAACTSYNYASPGKHSTRFIAIARVGLGKMKDYTKITYGLSSPPPGYDSCHGVRDKRGINSEFADDEYVIYRQNQQKVEYLVEVR